MYKSRTSVTTRQRPTGNAVYRTQRNGAGSGKKNQLNNVVIQAMLTAMRGSSTTHRQPGRTQGNKMCGWACVCVCAWGSVVWGQTSHNGSMYSGGNGAVWGVGEQGTVWGRNKPGKPARVAPCPQRTCTALQEPANKVNYKHVPATTASVVTTNGNRNNKAVGVVRWQHKAWEQSKPNVVRVQM